METDLQATGPVPRPAPDLAPGIRWRFVARMAGRELRAQPLKLAVFVLHVTLAVGAFVATQALLDRVEEVVAGESRALLSGDVAVHSRQPFPGELRGALDALRREEGIRITRTVEFFSMVVAGDGSTSRLCEIKAVEDGYPLYGTVVVEPPAALARITADRGEGPGLPALLVSPALAKARGFAVGSRVRLGETLFEVAGRVVHEPDRLGESFRLGPRVLMPRRRLEATGLLGFGAVRTHRELLAFEDPGRAVVAARELQTLAGTAGVDVDTAREGSRSTQRLVSRVRSFLVLAGVALLAFVTLGAAVAARLYVDQRMDLVHVLRCLGAPGRTVVAVLAVQIGVLSLAGSLAGVVLGVLGQDLLVRVLAGVLPVGAGGALRPETLVTCVVAGVLFPGLGALMPLLPTRRISPREISLRPFTPGPAGRRLDGAVVLVGTALVLGFLGLVRLRLDASDITTRFLAAFPVAALAFWIASRLVIRGLRRVGRLGPFWLRQGMTNLHRPGNQTTTVTLALGLGVFLILTVTALRDHVVEEFAASLPPDAPNLFVIDVQQSQKDELVRVLAGEGIAPQEVVPLVRSRLVALDGIPVETLHPDPAERPWYVKRDYVVSDRDYLTVGERIVAGTFLSPGSRAEASVEARSAERLGLELGSTLTLSVQGVELTARVTSIRQVNWSSLRPNFFILLSPALLRQAGRTWFVVARAGTDSERERVQTALARAFPNVTVIDASVAVEILGAAFRKFSQGISLVASGLMIAGLLILVGSLLMTREARSYELAILKAMGASARVLLATLAVEYLALGALGGLLGAIAGTATAWVLADRVLEITPVLKGLPIVRAALVTSLATAAVGALASLGTFRRRPLDLLRAP